MQIRTLVVEDDPAQAERLRLCLTRSNRFSLARVCGNSASALEYAQTAYPDLAIVDLQLPDGDGTNLVREFRLLRPRMRLIVFTIFDDIPRVFEAIEAGASGYVLKSDSDEQILAHLWLAWVGGAPISPAIARQILNQAASQRREAKHSGDGGILSKREQQVLTLLSLGLKAPEIAKRLDVSDATVRTHIERIYRKLDAHTRADAIQKGWETGLLRPPGE